MEKSIQNYALYLAATAVLSCAAPVEQDERVATGQEALNQTTNFAAGVTGIEYVGDTMYKTATRWTRALDQTAFGSSYTDWAMFLNKDQLTGMRVSLSAFDRIPILGGVDFRFTLQARCYDAEKAIDGAVVATPWASQLTGAIAPAASPVTYCFSGRSSPHGYRLGLETRAWPGGNLSNFRIGAQGWSYPCADATSSASLGAPVYTDWIGNIPSGSTSVSHTAAVDGCQTLGERLLFLVQ